MEAEILAEVIRGEAVESLHRGHLCIAGGDGRTLASLGNPETVTFFRSASKAFQAVPMITSGAAQYFDFKGGEIALACASHSGEKQHTVLVADMLENAGLNENHLKCGAHLPFHEPTAEAMIRSGEKPTQIHNNCSGKHAAMLAFAKHTGADIETYEHLENPIQQKILETIALFTGVPPADIKIGIDGCAAPNFALPISAMARSFARLVNPPESFDENLKNACRKIVSAKIRYPELVGGSERLDTLLMQTAEGKIISKVGAEGVWLCGVLPCEKWKSGLGIALKIEDGDDRRARPAISVEILRQLGMLENEDLADLSPLPLNNRRGDLVGKVEPKLKLNMAAEA